MKYLNKALLTFIIFGFGIFMPVLSYELDLSVDEEIKKKYNSSKLNYDVLPALPKIEQTNYAAPKTNLEYNTQEPHITKSTLLNSINLPKWTTLSVKSNQTITDRIAIGSSVNFTTTSTVYKRNVTIPAGTKLIGVVTDSHTPQISGNGGLIVIKLTNIILNGNTYTLNGKITKANNKKIFFNNIKGKRQYIKSVGQQFAKGENFYKKSRQLSTKFSNNPILTILSPIPTLVGVVGYVINTAVSPIIAIGSKGQSISIPAGNNFEIRVLN